MDMFFDNWSGMLRVLMVGTVAYVCLVLMLRISGNRTLSKMSAFDLIVTVALGSTLATVLLTKNVTLAEGLLAFMLLIGLQWILAWLSVRSERWRNLIKAEPRLLLYRGQFLNEAMRKERITPDEVRAAARSKGIASLEQIEAAVLESDGSVTVIPAIHNESGARDALRGVNGLPEEK